MLSLQSVSQLAELVGKSTRTVKARCHGLPVTVGPKNAHLYESRHALPLILARAHQGDGELDLGQERARLAIAQTQRAELETARIKREVIPVREVEADLMFVAGTVVNNLSAIPGRLCVPLAAVSDPAEIRDLLRKEIIDVRKQISRTLEKYAHALEQSDGDTPRGNS